MSTYQGIAYFTQTREEWLALRKQDITSTEVSALFNMSKYATAFELALLKAGEIEDQFRASERSRWGLVWEDSIAAEVSARYGIETRRKREYMRIPEIRMGASFDFEITACFPDWVLRDGDRDDNRLRTLVALHGPGLLELKNVDALIFRNEWNDEDGNLEAPPHIEIQLQQQLMVSGYKWGVIAVLVGGNRLHLVIRMADEAVHLGLAKKVAAFWRDHAQGVYPQATFPDDVGVMKLLYSHAEPGNLKDFTGDKVPEGMSAEIDAYITAAAEEKAAGDRKKTAHAKLLKMIGDAEKVVTDAATISCGVIPETVVESYTRKSYRMWRVTPRKPAKVKQKKGAEENVESLQG